MIKTIIFDLGGVLFTNGTKKFIADISKRYHFPQAMVTEAIDGDTGTLYRESKISRDEYWDSVLETLKIPEGRDVLEKEWISGYELISGTKDILLELKKKYTVFYLSDNIKERADALEQKYHFMEWFSGGIFSHEVGVRKPDPKIYELVLQKAECNPEEAIFIDDKSSALAPAHSMGIHTILFISPEDLKERLEKSLQNNN